MDVGTGVAVVGLSYELIKRVLGPTADYLGSELQTLVEKKLNNLSRIFSSAERKLGDKIETEGAVPPRVLKGILDEGSFCDDALMAEYFGGVLASSRSGTSRDDRGASFIALISRLSTYQIRTHYIFYHMVKDLFNGTSLNSGISDNRRKMETYLPFEIYLTAMEFDRLELKKSQALFDHTMYGLNKESLIEDGFKYGSKEHVAKFFKNATKPGVIFQPSILGIELFLWAYGKSDLTGNDFFKTANQFEIDSSINIAPGYMKTKE